jgi:hypothetical protein
MSHRCKFYTHDRIYNPFLLWKVEMNLTVESAVCLCVGFNVSRLFGNTYRCLISLTVRFSLFCYPKKIMFITGGIMFKEDFFLVVLNQ